MTENAAIIDSARGTFVRIDGCQLSSAMEDMAYCELVGNVKIQRQHISHQLHRPYSKMHQCCLIYTQYYE